MNMSDKIVLSAEPRTDVGKGASRRLRRAGERIPAVVYGGSEPPQSLSLVANELSKAEKVEAFYSQILELQLEGKVVDAIVKDLQRHPARGDIMHVDLQRVAADQELHVSLPLHFVGEESCPGVKLQGGQILHNMNEVQVSCLPSALPEYIEVDVGALDAGDSIHLSELQLPEGVRIIELEYGADHDQVVLSVAAKKGGADADDEDGEGEAEAEGGDEG
jgi:large subunit ribosomal protein L25